MRRNDVELLSIGDASLDVFITPTESDTYCQIDDKDCFLSFSYGDKIPVKRLEFSIGGNAANNAVGIKRLGVKSACMLTLGDDSIGNQIVEKLIFEGVDTSYVFRQSGSSSNYSTAVVVRGERTIFTYKSPREYAFAEETPKVSWVYLTSMADNFESIYKSVVDWVKRDPNIKLAFNPGSRQLRAGADSFSDVMNVSHIIYVNRKEAESIVGMDNTQGKEKELLSALAKLGPKNPIVTDGVNGSFTFDGKKYLKAGILPIDSYERTGAGDAFGSGCVAALIKGKSMEEALVWGTVNSASVIGYAGAQKGLLTESEISEWLERAKSCKVEIGEF